MCQSVKLKLTHPITKNKNSFSVSYVVVPTKGSIGDVEKCKFFPFLDATIVEEILHLFMHYSTGKVKKEKIMVELLFNNHDFEWAKKYVCIIEVHIYMYVYSDLIESLFCM